MVYDNSFSQDVSETTPLSTSFTVNNPELWSVENPVLYSAEITLSSEDTFKDIISIPFGIRTIEATAERILLNGKSIKLKGDMHSS